MGDFQFTIKDPDKGYINSNLLLPKSKIHEGRIKVALTFIHGDETIYDENTGEPLSVVPGTLELWDETTHHLITPREFLTPEQRKQFDFEFIDEREQVHFDRVDIVSSIQPRDEGQERALAALRKHQSGTLTLSCGKGKTIMALAHAAELGVPTMIVVNTTALLEQWKEEINLHLDVESIGVVQGDVADWEGHPIVISMVHTLSSRHDDWSMEFRRRFGLVIYDEGHHMSAPVFVKSADLFYGQRYSLTATPNRTDGLEAVYQYHLGKVIHSNLEQDLIPTSWFHALYWEMTEDEMEEVVDMTGSVNLNKVRTFLGRLEWRNDIICDDIRFDLASGRKLLVLSHSVEHVARLYQPFRKEGAGMITGATPQELRMDILRECNPVFGTFQLAREGLNKPSLDTLYNTTPFSNPNDQQQSWGRIQRLYADKKDPIVRVYEDRALTSCVRACRKLKKTLKKWGHPVRRKKINVILEET